MAKKSQTRARRNNTQVGPQVVNFYNHGTVNVDARQNNSTSPKYSYSGCTFNYSQSRPFTIEDQIDPGHPIFSQSRNDSEIEVIPETIQMEEATSPTEIQNDTRTSKNLISNKMWQKIAVAGLATAAMLSLVFIHK